MRYLLLVITLLALVGSTCDTMPASTSNGETSGVYDPATGLQLEANDLTLTVPPNAASGDTTLSMRPATASDLPLPLPGGVGLAGGVFGPDGQTFQVPAQVSVRLPEATIVSVLPVVTFDVGQNRWVGTGSTGDVAANGLDVSFELDHFSIAGVPTPVAIPDPGDAIGSFLVVSNNGSFQSDEISSDTASMIYSEFGDTFNISLTSQDLNMEGQIETKALGLSAVLVTRVDNYLVGVVGGGASLFNAGQLNEPAVGVMVMSLNGSTVNLSVYVATPQRVIAGTLSGPAS